MSPYVAGTLVWLAIALAASALELARELLLAPRLGPRNAERVEVALRCAVVVLGSVALVRWAAPTPAQGARIGLLWLALTLALELGFRRLALREPLRRILAELDPRRAPLSAAPWLCLFLAPWLLAM